MFWPMNRPLELTQEQRRIVVCQELEYKLVTMKQYLSDDAKKLYFDMLEIYSTLVELEEFMKVYNRTWPTNHD